MNIAIDVMGGDNGPGTIIKGSIDYLSENVADLSVTFVGNRDLIEKELSNYNTSSFHIDIVNTTEVVQMDDSPSSVFKTKPNSSMNTAIKLQAEGKVDASLSTGNTGALMVASLFILGRIDGVQRPTIPAIAPSQKGNVIFLDVGANLDCKPQHLLQFAIMGEVYSKIIANEEKPRIGLLSVGTEKTKGNELTSSTYKLLENSDLNFIGNVEGYSFIRGGAEVIVCDGFVGNTVLKLLESFAPLVKHSAEKNPFNASEFGGTPFLGINGICLKSHGNADPMAIKNAIVTAKKLYSNEANKIIKNHIKDVFDVIKS